MIPDNWFIRSMEEFNESSPNEYKHYYNSVKATLYGFLSLLPEPTAGDTSLRSSESDKEPAKASAAKRKKDPR